MTDTHTTQRPTRFTIIAILLVLWGLIGIAAFYMDVSMTPAKVAELPAWDQQFYATRPGWFTPLYGIAVWGGALGSLALLLRRGLAVPLYLASLIAAVVQFGYVFLMTDLISAKGAVATLPFPILIIAIAGFQLWLARSAKRRGWLR